jgi:transcriptional regulator with XRE-family HTH domain
MNTKKHIVFPKQMKVLEEMGEQFKLARKRRGLTLVQVAERAGIHRETLRKVEKGEPGVALGAYFNVLKVLNLENDFLKLAADDDFGRKLQDLNLLKK